MQKLILISFSILLITNNASSNEKLDIFLNDINTKQKGRIVLKVCNNNNKEPLNYMNVSVEKRLNGKWENIRFDIECPCNAKCKKRLTEIREGQCKDYFWDLMDGECEQATSGEYRFVIVDRWSDAIKGYLYLGASESFFINPSTRLESDTPPSRGKPLKAVASSSPAPVMFL